MVESKEGFRAFYEKELVQHLQTLEVQRKKLAVKLNLSIAFGIIGLFLSIYFLAGFHNFSLKNHSNSDFIIALILLVAWAMLAVLVYKKVFYKKLQEIRFKFKRSVIVKIVDFVDPALKYRESRLITRDEYNASKLFPVKPHTYYGEDYILGKNGAVPYKFSELHTKYTMKDHRGRKLFYTIFRGLFFLADTGKQFKAETVVLPDTAHKLFGPLGDYIQDWNIFREQVVKIDDAEFDKEFVVYSNNLEESKKILTSQLMKRITEFKKKSGHKIFLSFINTHVNLAIPLDTDLFEPPVFGNMLNFELIYENYKYLKLATGIVDDLDLNDQTERTHNSS
ncbi:MAG: hypothetical protein COA57_08930 [Flavobacteriales bacterium]|nr:MAG: hypothetical protein COA57_08930 [Flavobacteriales bacterium]